MTEENKKLEYRESTKYGTLRELNAIKKFMEQGFTVSIPNMSVRYDFVAERNSVFINANHE